MMGRDEEFDGNLLAEIDVGFLRERDRAQNESSKARLLVPLRRIIGGGGRDTTSQECG